MQKQYYIRLKNLLTKLKQYAEMPICLRAILKNNLKKYELNPLSHHWNGILVLTISNLSVFGPETVKENTNRNTLWYGVLFGRLGWVKQRRRPGERRRAPRAAGCSRNASSPSLTRPGWVGSFLKGAIPGSVRRAAEAGARRPLWRAASFDLIVNGTPSFFNGFGKKVSSDPNGNVTGSYEIKCGYMYTFYEGVILIVGRPLLFRNVDGLSYF